MFLVGGFLGFLESKKFRVLGFLDCDEIIEGLGLYENLVSGFVNLGVFEC